jgi:hypothetical protein
MPVAEYDLIPIALLMLMLGAIVTAFILTR